MTALVTGGAGFIGSNLVRALLERGEEVRVLDNFSTGSRANLEGLGVEIVEGELRSYERVHNAVRGTEVVYHLGALGSVPRSVQDPLTSNAVNVEGTLNVLLAAFEQPAHEVRADEPGAAGDQNTAHDDTSSATPARPNPIQVTASIGMPAMMPTAFHAPAATRMNPAADRARNDGFRACFKATTIPVRKVATPSTNPTTPVSASSST